jgi:signal transduction histidine kinase
MIYTSKVRRLEDERRTQEQFSQKLIESQEKERKRIAGELHDSLGQNLLIIYNLIQQYFQRTKVIPPELAQVEPEVKETIEEVRKISRNLHPHQLEQLGLTKAIESIAKKVSNIADINFKTDIEFIDDYIKAELSIHVFRIIQEAITNIIKHSNANEGSLKISLYKKVVSIAIKDNGIGIKKTQTNLVSDEINGFGLENIKERVRLLNAELKISSTLNVGTKILIDIPIENV